MQDVTARAPRRAPSPSRPARDAPERAIAVLNALAFVTLAAALLVLLLL